MLWKRVNVFPWNFAIEWDNNNICMYRQIDIGTRDKGQGTRDEGRGTRDKGQGTRDKGH